MLPFYYLFENAAYSLLFPVKNVAENEEINRNYIDNLLAHTRPEWQAVLRIPWQELDLSNEPIKFSYKDDAYFLVISSIILIGINTENFRTVEFLTKLMELS
jgi:hypothetical protein